MLPGQLESDACTGLLQEWRGVMLRVLQRRRIPCELAEDLVQEALIVAWRERRKLRDISRASAWVRSIVMNRMRTHYARQQQPPQSLDIEPMAVHETPCDVAMRNEASVRAQRFLATLAPQHAQLLWLRHGEGMSPQEIAQHLGVDRIALRHRLHKSRMALQKSLRTAAVRKVLASWGIENQTMEDPVRSCS